MPSVKITMTDHPIQPVKIKNPHKPPVTVVPDPPPVVPTVDLTPASIAITPTSATPTVGSTVQITATVYNASAAALGTTVDAWHSSNTGVATVNATGLVTIVAEGTALITATITTPALTSNACTITIASVPASIQLAAPLPTLTIGDSEQIIASVLNASGFILVGVVPSGWVSANPSVVTVSGTGLVHAVAAGGPVLITASIGGLTSSTPITVTGPDLVAASVAITPTTISFQGGSAQLTAEIKNAGGVVLNLSPTSWTSSNQGICTVDSTGLVTFVGVGTASVSAHYNALVSNACTVTGVASGGGGGGSNFVKHDFEDGTLGPFYNPWGTGIDVFTGTIGGRTGKFARMHYQNFPPTNVDSNVGLFPIVTFGIGLGQTVWFQGDFFIDNTLDSAVDALRKLNYWSSGSEVAKMVVSQQPGLGPATNNFVVSAVRPTGRIDDFVGTVTNHAWHRLKIRMTVNTAIGVSDGVLQVWLDGDLRENRSDVQWGDVSDPTFSFNSFGVGYQAQADSAIQEYHYWDNISYATAEGAL